MSPFDPIKIAAARKLIADCEARLAQAEKIFSGNRYAVCDLNAVRQMLRRVRVWKEDGDATVTLALCFLGPNGWLPNIDRLCALAEAEREQVAA